jgi:hypothetical protein
MRAAALDHAEVEIDALIGKLETVDPATEYEEMVGSVRACGSPEASGYKLSDVTIKQRNFGIRVVNTSEGRSSASLLINKMYAWRGYAGTHLIDDNPNRFTLSASDECAVVGTVTLNIDSPIGLLADEVFKDLIDPFRARGTKVCEVTKLAFDPAVRSKIALASLFHILFIYGRRMHACTDVFIEVNPRHRRFYETMLGFKRLTEARVNPRVDAPAYFLWASLDDVQEKIERLGGRSNHPGNERSLFPYFFSPKEEEGIVGQLMSRLTHNFSTSQIAPESMSRLFYHADS